MRPGSAHGRLLDERLTVRGAWRLPDCFDTMAHVRKRVRKPPPQNGTCWERVATTCSVPPSCEECCHLRCCAGAEHGAAYEVVLHQVRKKARVSTGKLPSTQNRRWTGPIPVRRIASAQHQNSSSLRNGQETREAEPSTLRHAPLIPEHRRPSVIRQLMTWPPACK